MSRINISARNPRAIDKTLVSKSLVKNMNIHLKNVMSGLNRLTIRLSNAKSWVSAICAGAMLCAICQPCDAQCTGGNASTPVTVVDETGSGVPNSRQLINGTNTTIDISTPGKIKVNASGGGGGTHNYFGSGADGAVTYSTNTTIGSSTPDTTITVKNYSSLTINSGVTVQPAARDKAVLIYVTGNCDIEGTLSVSAFGANATPSQIDLWKYPAISNTFFSSESSNQTVTTVNTDYQTATAGAAGGATRTTSGANAGSAGATNQTGGGGSGAGDIGGAGNIGYGGAGAAGTSFSGGAGGGAGGFNGSSNVQGSAGGSNGGAGGNAGAQSTGYSEGSGGGAGNPGGTGTASNGGSGSNGGNGTGGVLYLIVGGNLTIGAAGVISANGVAGGNASASGGEPGGAGGSGGGRIVILYAGTLSNSGTIQANGGAGGTASGSTNNINGGAGGAGTITGPIQISGS